MFTYNVFILLASISVLATSSPITNDNRIFNGKPSERGQFPFYVYLQIDVKNEGFGSCGAILISDQWIVTAGHCIVEALKVEIHLGALIVKNVNERDRIIVHVTRNSLTLHPDFEQKHYGNLNDIGLIKLPQPVVFTEAIQPVKLPKSCESVENLDALAIGSGYISEIEHKLPKFLQWAQLSTYRHIDCKSFFPEMNPDSLICAKGKGGEAVCVGDSGGPLVRQNDSVLIGLISFGENGKCDLGLTSAFTDVTFHLEWLTKVTGLEFS